MVSFLKLIPVKVCTTETQMTKLEIQLNHNSVYKTRGAVRVGAWKPISATQAIQEAVELAAASDGELISCRQPQPVADPVHRPSCRRRSGTDAGIRARGG
jgi:hypothetical protein